MLPTYARRVSKKSSGNVLDEEEYVPRADEGKPIIQPVDEPDLGEPASVEDLNKAFAQSNASRLLFDDVRNGKMGNTFKDDEAYNLNILPMSQSTNEASLEEDWCQMNINTQEQVGSYKDRLGRTIPLYAEKIPPKQFVEPQVTKATRNMELFTGVIPMKKKVETPGIVPDREETSLTRYKKAASATIQRQENDLSTNSSHTQSFTQRDTCREGYHGYNMLDGHDKRARTLVDTNRNYYKNYVVPLKGIDEDGQVPYTAEKTSKKEVDQFKRHLSIGNGGHNDRLETRSIPVLSSAKVVIEGRTGGIESNVGTSCVKSSKHRIYKKENGTFASEHGQFEFDNASTVKSKTNPSSRQNLPENKLQQQSFDSGANLRSDVVASMSVRDAIIVNGVEHAIPEHEECNIRPDQERLPGEDDPEIESILIQQCLDECRVQPNTILNNDSTINVSEIYGEDGPNAMPQYSDVLPSHRLPETSVEHHVMDHEQMESNATRPNQLLGTSDADEQNTFLVESNSFKQGRVNVPKERRPINKEKINREARINESNVGCSTNIRSGVRPINSLGAQNIADYQNISRFTEHGKQHQRPNVITGKSDDTETNRMGFIKGFMQTLNYVLPIKIEKEQLVSGSEQLKLPTGHLAIGSDLPTISQTEELKDEIVLNGRMGNTHAPLLNNLSYNMPKSHAKRGLQNVDRLSSSAHGKRGVVRDTSWLPGLADSKESTRGEHYRPPSAVSDTGSICMPNLELKRDSVSQRAPLC